MTGRDRLSKRHLPLRDDPTGLSKMGDGRRPVLQQPNRSTFARSPLLKRLQAIAFERETGFRRHRDLTVVIRVAVEIAEAVAAQLGIEALAAQAEHFGGRRAVVARQFECGLDAETLDHVGRLAHQFA